METLARKKGRPAGPIQVLKDDSMTLSFKVPSSIKLPQASSILRVVTPPIEAPAAITTTTANVEEDVEEDSWECKTDFALDLNAKAVDMDDEWEECTAEAFPDDFPILLVNLSKLSVDHMGVSLATNEDATLISNKIQEIFASSKFSYVLEVLLEQETAYHATYGAYKARLAQLTGNSVDGDDVWAAIDYPALIDGAIPLSDILDVLRRPTKWRSVNFIKDCMSQSSRDIKWKAQVIAELEKLAESEEAARNSRQEALRVEIEQVASARDVYDRKLESLEGHHDTKSVMARQFARSRLEETNATLSRLVDAYLATTSPSHRRHEDEMLSGEMVKDMNVVDMIVSMVFSRLPRHPSTSIQTHYQSLNDSHEHIRKLWVDDFGRLPPRSRQVHLDEDGHAIHDIVSETGSTRPSFPHVSLSDDHAHADQLDRIYPADSEIAVAPATRATSSAVEASGRVESAVRKPRRKKTQMATKSKPTFQPLACVGAFSLLQVSDDGEANYMF
ncbi:hypothetical protein H310_02251 [Aphanomyces invadans]|uniref:Uncharacterized protein n=1 Tax=Aphanomyces invadans TaxID=157072 RepID=A0A024UPQ6_9STRA|nr:hypothetical protein H310_02251 [Aphanomyces invadans]ETW07827.1 hypothetical protein H310_02251 [Aphanomyces invadans]|eukprot:XP_008863920.1 hypothetical protein H310_02251 [Aphanomyces invadans]